MRREYRRWFKSAIIQVRVKSRVHMTMQMRAQIRVLMKVQTRDQIAEGPSDAAGTARRRDTAASRVAVL